MNLQYLLSSAFERRANLFGRDDVNCFRLFNSDGDGIGGLSVDRYGEYLLVQYYAERAGGIVPTMTAALEKAIAPYPMRLAGIVVKDRTKEKGTENIADSRRSRVLSGMEPPADYRVRQNGLDLCVDLMKGQSTGVFLDMREVRDSLAASYPAGGTMLNLFCYTALFSVHALKHGLEHAVNVDLSGAVLRKARENYRLNGLSRDERDFIRGDAWDWLGRFKKRGAVFSLAVIDPPTFARHKKRVFSVKKDIPRYLASLSHLVPQGMILSAVNSHTVNYKEYRSFHPGTWQLLMYANEASDFVRAGDPYLKVGLWRT